MSLIWKCFSMLGFTLLTAAVSFRFGLIFQTVLPICPFSPTSRIAVAAISVFDSFSTLLNQACCMRFFTKLLVDNLLIVSGVCFN